jgi:hypothetical protein
MFLGVWQELPFIPTEKELAGNLVEADKHLSPVKNSYLDAESYMDTYFRLLRAETFSAIQHGIKDLKACELDERDMNVYHNVHLAGFEIQNGRFSLAIYFTPGRMVKNWKASPQLMFGNLVCISLNRKFDDVIWAVVSNRDADILNKHQIIMLELIDENTKKMSEIISSLQAHAGNRPYRLFSFTQCLLFMPNTCSYFVLSRVENYFVIEPKNSKKQIRPGKHGNIIFICP